MAGKRHGTWRYWQRNGDLKETRKYENGRLVSTISRPRWHAAGEEEHGALREQLDLRKLFGNQAV